MVESIRNEQLAVMLHNQEAFVVYIESEKGYFRSIYGETPTLGHICAIMRGEKDVVVGTICKVDGISQTFEDREDTVENLRFLLVALPRQSYSTHGQPKYKDVPLSRVPCILKRINSILIEAAIEKKRKEEDDEEYVEYVEYSGY